MMALLLVGGLLLPRLAAADALAGIGEADRGQIAAVIRSQLDAFRHDDGGAAFAFASPTIQGIFQTPEHFLDMVRTAYPPVYRPREVEFRDLVDYRGQPTQRVLLVGPDGRPMVAYYMMQRQPDGSWKINGCVLMGADEVAA
jgi:hypothetical protein